MRVPGALREHLLRIEFDFELGTRGLPPRVGQLSISEPDLGEGGSAAVRMAWAVLGKRERPLMASTIMKLKEDARLGELLYESAVREMPHE